MKNHNLSVIDARSLARYMQQSEDRRLELRRALIERAIIWNELRSIILNPKLEQYK
jgi:hypothetical protein